MAHRHRTSVQRRQLFRAPFAIAFPWVLRSSVVARRRVTTPATAGPWYSPCLTLATEKAWPPLTPGSWHPATIPPPRIRAARGRGGVGTRSKKTTRSASSPGPRATFSNSIQLASVVADVMRPGASFSERRVRAVCRILVQRNGLSERFLCSGNKPSHGWRKGCNDPAPTSIPSI